MAPRFWKMTASCLPSPDGPSTIGRADSKQDTALSYFCRCVNISPKSLRIVPENGSDYLLSVPPDLLNFKISFKNPVNANKENIWKPYQHLNIHKPN